MTTALTACLASATSSTLSTANKLYTTSGSPSIVENDTLIGTQSGWIELYSQGNASLQTAGGSIGSPSAHGFFLDTTVLEGQVFPATANGWSGAIRSGLKATDTCTVQFTVRAYRYHSGTYTNIVTMVTTSQNFTTSSAVNISVPATTGTGSIAFATGDKLYVDVWANITTAATLSTQKLRFDHLSTDTSGLTGDPVSEVVTPGYQVGVTTVTKTLPTRFRLRVQKNLTVAARFIERVQSTRTVQVRFLERTQKSLTIGSRFLERVGVTKAVPSRFLLRTQRTLTAQIRFILQKISITKTIAFRFLERVGITKSVPVRTLLRVQKTVTTPVRLVMRRYTLILKARVLIRVLKTVTIAARARIATQRTQSLPARFLERTLKTVTTPIRVLIRTFLTRSIPFRTRLATKITKTLPTRFLERVLNSVTLQFRVRLLTPAITTKSIIVRLILRSKNTTTLAFRLRLVSTLLSSGGFSLFASGPGTARFDSFRATQFPDPALSLAPILPRVGTTSTLWNAVVPTNTSLGMDVSLDGVNWTDVSGLNGGTFPGIFSQPDPLVDGFRTNTSVNYTSTYRTGGAPATVMYDVANSRLSLTGGINALYLYTSINDNDVDLFVDMDRADAGGLVWRFADQNNFYFLQIGDSLSSTGTANTATLTKVQANTQTQLATAPIVYTVGNPGSSYMVNFTRGTYRRFRVSMLGSVITVYVDGVQLLTYTDSSPIASGQMGLFNNGGTVGSRYYQLWMQQIGDYVSGTPNGDMVTSKFVYTRQRLATTDPSVSPQVLDLTTNAFTPMISPGVTIPSITYNASFLNKNFDDLAKQSNFSWYIDQNKNFVFRAGSTVAAPWILQSAPAGLVTNVDLEVDTNLELDVANDLYRNRQIILGATSTANFSETKIGDGSTRTFTLGYPLAAVPTLILDGVTKTNVGLKGTTGHDYYYALNDPIITQDPSNTVLQSGDNLVIAYTGVTTATVIVDNTSEQQARALAEGQGTGIVESVEDHTGENLTVAAATTLAQQLIARYAIAGRTLVFQTSRNGLAIGQTLTIFLPEHGITDGQFLINQVEIFLAKGIQDTQTWWYKITCSELPKQDSWAKLVASGIALQ